MNDRSARRYLANLRIERDNAALYERLADLASDERKQRAYRRIALAETANAAFWEAQLHAMRVEVPRHEAGIRVRVLSWFARRFGTEFVMPTVVRLEHADHVEPSVDRKELRNHFAESAPLRSARRDSRGQSGNTLRAAVLGANDGLVSNVSLVMGMAGASGNDKAVLTAGIAGLVAGACSMALGEWLSVNSSREFYQAQIAVRAERLAVAPEDGARSIAGIYRDKGLEPQVAETVAERLSETPRAALDTLVREDLGIDPEDLGGSAYSAAISSFCMFALGAAFPVAPYLFLGGSAAMLASAAATAFALALIGIGTSLFTGRSVVFSIARQLGITAAAASITYAVGHVIGGALIG
ncbi:VIT1/CCC1 family predicted Fe2+/Mn2+ transporter [Dyella sp. SG562]|uniref:VIT1/CCC1 transporter family protein n=1 Tax=Dyella TaxID=231454 RepID=UPI00142433E2|nr:VIT1/CCC1 transporter family protein [Dyella sp. SG562]NII75489.1 VIT1/CCC1 family predicted Fe2+/Mn2+ transporter [Dyella sp. SG562]